MFIARMDEYKFYGCYSDMIPIPHTVNASGTYLFAFSGHKNVSFSDDSTTLEGFP